MAFNPGAAPTNPVESGPGPNRVTAYHIFGDIISTHMSSKAANVIRVKPQGLSFGNSTAHFTSNLTNHRPYSIVSPNEEQQAFSKWRRGIINTISTISNYASYIGLGIKHNIYPIPGSQSAEGSKYANV